MPWPKGTPRVGYIKKDGSPHAKKGEGRLTPRVQTDKDPQPKVQVIVKPRGEETVVKVKPTLHGQGSAAVIEPCPKCGFAYADGGYCNECGWTAYTPGCPHCKKGN